MQLPRWESLSLRTKRLIFLPVIAFAGLSLIRAYTPIIILGLILWFLYQWSDHRIEVRCPRIFIKSDGYKIKWHAV